MVMVMLILLGFYFLGVWLGWLVINGDGDVDFKFVGVLLRVR